MKTINSELHLNFQKLKHDEFKPCSELPVTLRPWNYKSQIAVIRDEKKSESTKLKKHGGCRCEIQKLTTTYNLLVDVNETAVKPQVQLKLDLRDIFLYLS